MFFIITIPREVKRSPAKWLPFLKPETGFELLLSVATHIYHYVPTGTITKTRYRSQTW